MTSQIQKLRQRFGLRSVVVVADRGMLTEARIREELKPLPGMGWITALRGPQIRKLFQSGPLQLSLFDQRDLAEIQSPDYPGERLIVCRNPLLAEERARNRQQLLQATELELEKIVQATQRPKRRFKGKDRIALRVGKVLNRYKVGKHFVLEIGEESFSYQRRQERIEQEAALDGIYVIRTNLAREQMDAEQTVAAYKGLSVAERAFRSCKSVDLKVRPIYHHLEDRVRAHVFLCMLAYYVEWHMRQKLAPILFDDEDPEAGRQLRDSVVAPSQRSPQALRKAHRKRTVEGGPVHQLSDLAQRFGHDLQKPDSAAVARLSSLRQNHPSHIASAASPGSPRRSSIMYPVPTQLICSITPILTIGYITFLRGNLGLTDGNPMNLSDWTRRRFLQTVPGAALTTLLTAATSQW